MQAYSLDLRQRVLADCDAGLPTRQVAAKYRVSASWVRRLKQRRRQTGEVSPRPPRNRRRPTLDAHHDRLRALIAEDPDATLAELRDRLGVAIGLTSLWEAVRRLGLTVKKKSSAPPSKTGPMSRPSGSSGARPSHR
jgi:transposase